MPAILPAPHRQERLANVDTGDRTLRLAKRPAHAGLQAIRPGARQHLVDTQHVERMDAYAKVEGVLASVLGHVLVAGYAGGLDGLRGELLLFVRHHVRGKRKLVDIGFLTAEV
eukprot:CAMPEP_0198350702 /NCGR_PEP_ID=MMETSP1450-20131203/100011_1 /TAXON_ID=753684 ORGANISM="Madagascaria erythrocladiodes, Strain CCMP3234" /NCGR_SAMPLE_ID=MMETSP1450 /ASSEMBLY_ACC=CAM_ASM_001115 /LENGTH=112 /DNA_ID=CAMNT_0044056547 /DNA_START=494 /DNA_END=829 /DNA_ORIENTATION=-